MTGINLETENVQTSCPVVLIYIVHPMGNPYTSKYTIIFDKFDMLMLCVYKERVYL